MDRTAGGGRIVACPQVRISYNLSIENPDKTTVVTCPQVRISYKRTSDTENGNRALSIARGGRWIAG